MLADLIGRRQTAHVAPAVEAQGGGGDGRGLGAQDARRQGDGGEAGVARRLDLVGGDADGRPN